MQTYASIALALAVAMLPATPLGAQSKPSLAPVLAASEGWLNGHVSPASLAGKVVVVDVFTFGCYNCRNVVPNLRAVNARRSKDVAIVGIHSPETPYEKDRANVVENLKSQGIVWPVAIDTSFTIWNAYGVSAWPTQLVFDRHGRLRKTIVGDSQDDELNVTISELVAEK